MVWRAQAVDDSDDEEEADVPAPALAPDPAPMTIEARLTQLEETVRQGFQEFRGFRQDWTASQQRQTEVYAMLQCWDLTYQAPPPPPFVYLEACRRKHQGVPLSFGVVATTMERKVSVAVGSQVWVEDPDVAWIDGEVLEVKGSEIKISCSTGRAVTAKISDVHPKDPKASPSGLDDMTKLAYLYEPDVLLNLRARYDINEIYIVTCALLALATYLEVVSVLPYTRSTIDAEHKGKT
ncbi:hypothetical protein ZIOFF_043373 [Zingiber officinale]|uniref:Myosin N-terminal SH3-like domain-containing protein n=1 Tax=Zingiber officinale TaxID=94328 RepID=A0A8J5FZ44_ZINOF|nr:hypothetical protein ZIOFF_043373 [Zingiber officinale]